MERPFCDCEACKNQRQDRVLPTDYWDVTKHREELKVSSENTVYHPVRGQLCYWESKWDGIIYYPLRFKDKAAAYRWVEAGYIAEIQEGMMILQVGFSTICFQPKNS